MILPYDGSVPKIAADVFVAEGAVVIGNVTIGSGSSIWFGTVVRGDVESITIGARTNIQDNSVCHCETGLWPLKIGDEVTIGHRAIIHGCTIENRALIGMGAIVMNGAVVGAESVVGAGAVVTEKMVVPPRHLVLGMPAKIARKLNPEEVGLLQFSAAHYYELAQSYLKEGR